ncbi:hypothetical protein LTR62_002513 [Meristemomyces frigidus]|uniref:NmrA-like domain-containing protein n=1 Tax=Meristemomyces frigidus TaxID=1508187 RepID=A0AAN7TLX6_9PEZI|nr:hypothetical protein LTR62_002513 [Meristemomyces frigidus]
MASVIIFGPTGNIASVAALTAAEHGAKVFLAMRDASKTIRGLTPEHEKSGKFERVQADMSKPETVAEAVRKTGAKRAFIYLAHGTPDHQKASIEALKSNGIDFVVFLSSSTIHKDPREIPAKEIIPFMHAQVEINLDDIFGAANFVSVRPGAFATNIARYKADIAKGECVAFGHKFRMDGVTPVDMGQVAGTILATGPKNGQHIVYVYGPKIMEQGEAIQAAGRVLGKEVKLGDLGAEQALEQLTAMFHSKPLAEYMVGGYSEDPTENMKKRLQHYEEGVGNVELYTGRPATRFEDWVRANQELFAV